MTSIDFCELDIILAARAFKTYAHLEVPWYVAAHQIACAPYTIITFHTFTINNPIGDRT